MSAPGALQLLIVAHRESMAAAIAEPLRRAGRTPLLLHFGETVDLAEQRPDLVLVHQESGDARALDLCRALKSTTATGLIPVVIVADDASAVAKLAALEAGADHWLPLPLGDEELVARTNSLLRARVQVRALEASHDDLRLRRDWVRYLVHDMRSPLAATITNLEFIATQPAAEAEADIAEPLADSRVALQRMAAMTADLLDNDRLQAGELRPRLEENDLVQLVQQAVAMQRSFDPAAAQRAIEVRSPPLAMLRFDRPLMARVVGNLLINALRYGPRDRPILIEVEANPGRAHLRIANSGPPVPEEKKERIFEPFVQLDAATHAPNGAGLGLAFCRLAIQAHAGKIHVENSGGLVVFVIELPV